MMFSNRVAAARVGRMGWVGRVGLLGLAALAALCAALALAPAGSAAPPEDLELILSLADDADNVVPPDSTIRVSAALRHSGLEENLEVTTGHLYVTGDLNWDALGRSRMAVEEQKVGAAAWRGSGAMFGDRFGAFGGVFLDDDTFFIRALQNDFTGQIWLTGAGKVYVYDVPSRTEIGIITPPAGAVQRSFSEGFAAYQEDADTGWVFVGSRRDAVTVPGVTCYERTRWGQFFATWRTSFTNTGTSCREVGRLYIYKVDRSTSPMTVDSTPCATVTPSVVDAVFQKDSSGAESGHLGGQFGFGVAVNEATETLVVGAPKMHLTGAARVFTKPSSAGGWCDLTYTDGVSLTPTDIPTDGGQWNSATNKQKSYSGRHWSTDSAGSGFGQQIHISGDGGTIVLGAFLKQYDDNNNNYGSGAGEVAVFVRPSGGWATDNSPDARLYVGTTPTYKDQRLGQYLTVSRDGSTIAAEAPGRPGSRPETPGHVYLWERPGGGWSGVDRTPTATLSAADGYNNDQFGHLGLDFNYDGDKLAVSNSKRQDTGDPATSSYYGRAWIFDKPAGGWADATTASDTAHQVESPEPRPGAWYGIISFVDDQTGRVVVTQHEDSSTLNPNVGPGAVWLLKPDPDEDNAWLPEFFAGSTCNIDGGEAVLDSGDDVNTCPLDLPSSPEVVIPPGTYAGTFTISGSVTVDGQVYSGTLDVRIGAVKEAAKAVLEIGTDTRGTPGSGDDRPHKTTLSPGESTVLRLRVLNESDLPSSPKSIASILITTSSGSLSSNINDREGALTVRDGRLNSDGCIGTGGLACQIRAASLTTGNVDEIDITLRAPRPASPGQATVRATVLSTAGETLATEVVTIRFAGLPAVYAIARPTTSLLNVGTPDEGAMPDDRDRMLLAVTAVDLGGNRVELPGTAVQRLTQTRAIPNHRLTIIGPDGQRNPGGIMARWAANEAGTGLQLDNDGNAIVEIDVDAEDAAALTAGEYTLEVRVDGETASRMFTVSGGPAMVTLGEPEGSLWVGEQVRLTATVTDSAGNEVPDNTPIRWLDSPTGTAPVMVQTSAETRVINGRASATYLVIGAGSGYVRATAGGVSDIQLLTLGAATSAPGATMIVQSLTPNTQLDSFTAWLGAASVQASEVQSAVSGASAVLLWQNGAWLRYAVVDGQEVPGSMNFTIERGSILWLSR